MKVTLDLIKFCHSDLIEKLFLLFHRYPLVTRTRRVSLYFGRILARLGVADI